MTLWLSADSAHSTSFLSHSRMTGSSHAPSRARRATSARNGASCSVSSARPAARARNPAMRGGDTSQNDNYNISAATFRTLTGQTLTQTSVIAQLLQPGTVYLPRVNSVDFRLSKKLNIGKAKLATSMVA